MRDTKRRLEFYSFFNHTGIAAHLEDMAQKGWMIEKITGFGWVYRRIEPKRLHFSVSYYARASEFDPQPSEGQREFQEFCEHTGWKLACSSAQLQIFTTTSRIPHPLKPTLSSSLRPSTPVRKRGFCCPTFFCWRWRWCREASRLAAFVLTQSACWRTARAFWNLCLDDAAAHLQRGAWGLLRVARKGQKAAEQGEF